jgi:hypothetical protein
MLLNNEDGLIEKFMTIEYTETVDTAPTYLTYMAFEYSESDPGDTKNGYFYAAYTKDDVFQIIKISDEDPYPIVQNFYQPIASTETYAPYLFMNDLNKPKFFYMSGTW